ncbi:MAG: hypothetical protein SW833_08965 [Cyanobacteriota bacterium]|nr:hypothetical protein [Cyanobacteriota bacterium]
MSQQLGIILMVDVDAAVKANTLKGNTYLFDNMKLQGSEGQGTDELVSAINGSYWMDGSQANEQVLNWLPYGVGSLPPSIPKTFLSDKAKNSDNQALADVKKLTDDLEKGEQQQGSVLDILRQIVRNTGVETKLQSRGEKRVTHALGSVNHKVMDVTGKLITDVAEAEIPEINSLNPIITDITGEAVDKNIIYPAAYGSPDMVTDGWYWAASVDTSKPGTYAYTMHVQLYKLAFVEGSWAWVPVDMTCDAYIKVLSDPKVNGFTGAGMQMLPLK